MLDAGEALPHTLFSSAADSTSYNDSNRSVERYSSQRVGVPERQPLHGKPITVQEAPRRLGPSRTGFGLLEQLEAFQRAHDDDVIVVERGDLPVPMAATAWGQRLLCQQVEAGPLECFFDEHIGNGPEDVPRG